MRRRQWEASGIVPLPFLGQKLILLPPPAISHDPAHVRHAPCRITSVTLKTCASRRRAESSGGARNVLPEAEMTSQSHQLGAHWVNQAIPDLDLRNSLRSSKGKAGADPALIHSGQVLAMEACA